jgi:dTDP-4-amino-4,6-dideoxygalactose transaminase
MNNILNNMEFVRIFEYRLSEYTGFKYAVCTDCCTNGILLSLELLYRLNRINKQNILDIPCHTYMSVPMTLINNGWRIKLIEKKWFGNYQIGNTIVYDAATDFDENMSSRYPDHSLICVSFQQKKRLSLGRGGVILTNNKEYSDILYRMVYDGRNPFRSDNEEIANNPNDIILGYHCYMDPEKAAIGITKLNQLRTPYMPNTESQYPDLRKLNLWT